MFPVSPASKNTVLHAGHAVAVYEAVYRAAAANPNLSPEDRTRFSSQIK